MTLWNVIHNGKVIDVVSYDDGILADEVKKSLIGHDGYPPDIHVMVYTAPPYDTSYIAEKANMIIRGATEIIGTINKPQTKNTRSYYIGGILEIEEALNGLHNKFRQIMAQCDETEDDYGLRHMGELRFGK
mgnify:CR=1 FL=1